MNTGGGFHEGRVGLEEKDQHNGASRKAAAWGRKGLRNKTPGHKTNKGLMPVTPTCQYHGSIRRGLVSRETPGMNELHPGQLTLQQPSDRPFGISQKQKSGGC